MAAQASHRTPSGRFIRAYLLTWGLLAAGGLTYLGSLVWHPHLSPLLRPQMAEPDPSIQAANKALAAVGSVRRTVTEMQKDLGSIKDTIGQREAEEKAAQARLVALEERVTTFAATPVAPPPDVAPEPTAKPRAGEKGKAAGESRQNGTEPPRSPARIVSVTEAPSAPLPPAVKPQGVASKAETTKAEPPKIETGSIAATKPVITFGEPEVTPAQQSFAVQIAAGPSLDALRLSWNILAERHGALALLQPRFIAPRAQGGSYRLLAGPLPSKADADRICAAMNVGKQGCFSTPHIGDPL